MTPQLSRLGEFRAQCGWWWKHRTARIHPAPVLIFGNQKSGTSAIAGLLGRVSQQDATIDVFFRCGSGVYTDVMRGSTSLATFVAKYKWYFTSPIIKDPDFALFLDDLGELFPRSKRLCVVRNPFENIRSILNRLGLPGDRDDLSADEWHDVRERLPMWYEVLQGSAFGHAGNSYIHSLAKRWSLFADAYERHRDSVELVLYEDFAEEKRTTVERLALRLGLDVQRDIAEDVDHQYQPKGQSCDPREFFGVENYEIIRAECGERYADLTDRCAVRSSENSFGAENF